MAFPSSNTKAKSSSMDHLIAGAVAGVVARCVVAPIDVIKIRHQARLLDA
jgi:hypothetical protein